MSHLSMILSSLFMILMVVYLAPNIFALNRGHILRNIALWLAIFCGLAAFYQTFGPDSEHPLFNVPDSMQGMNRDEAPKIVIPKSPSSDKKDEDGAGGFTPPKE
jgi:hypothetical protein